jgi:hypothetical protein
LSNVNNLSNLQGKRNISLFNNCKPIQGLTVGMKVAQTFVSTNGFSIQLNAYNPGGSPTDWMQYVFIISGNTISGSVQYWNSAAYVRCCQQPGNNNCSGTTNPCVCTPTQSCPVVTQTAVGNTGPIVNNLPSNNLPAGYNLQIELGNDNAGNITEATFVVIDNNNVRKASAPVQNLPLFPISSFQTDVVGPGNGQSTIFSGGAGTITYSVASGQLCLEGGLPDQCTGKSTPTAEDSNAAYGTIASCCGSTLTQSVTG